LPAITIVIRGLSSAGAATLTKIKIAITRTTTRTAITAGIITAATIATMAAALPEVAVRPVAAARLVVDPQLVPRAENADSVALLNLERPGQIS